MAEIQAVEGQMNGGGSLMVSSCDAAVVVVSKRQRRPSVRLGDIGDHLYDSHVRRTKPWKLGHDFSKDFMNASGKPSRPRPFTNFSSADGTTEFNETLDGDDKGNLDSVVIGSWKVKESKKRGSTATKRVRSYWVDGGGGEEKYSGGEDVDDGYRDFEVENSESLLKDESPTHYGNRRSIKSRVSETRDQEDRIELSGPSDTNGGDWKCGNGGRRRVGADGVRIWLNGLGLSRYGPVFEIHEVDDEVLPLLTLEDLKDMGIDAVGSRRKMYCAIQKLGKGFS